MMIKRDINLLARASLKAGHQGADDTTVLRPANKGSPSLKHKKAARGPLLKLLIALNQYAQR
jgi:hypothetical protein